MRAKRNMSLSCENSFDARNAVSDGGCDVVERWHSDEGNEIELTSDAVDLTDARNLSSGAGNVVDSVDLGAHKHDGGDHRSEHMRALRGSDIGWARQTCR